MKSHYQPLYHWMRSHISLYLLNGFQLSASLSLNEVLLSASTSLNEVSLKAFTSLNEVQLPAFYYWMRSHYQLNIIKWGSIINLYTIEWGPNRPIISVFIIEWGPIISLLSLNEVPLSTFIHASLSKILISDCLSLNEAPLSAFKSLNEVPL